MGGKDLDQDQLRSLSFGFVCVFVLHFSGLITERKAHTRELVSRTGGHLNDPSLPLPAPSELNGGGGKGN